MKKISYWASRHIKTARLLLVCIKFLLIALAYYTGMELYKMEVILPSDEINYIALLVLFIVIVIYPRRTKTVLSKNRAYIKQKTCDFILPLCSFIIIATTVNNGGAVTYHSSAYGSAILKNPTAQEILASGKTKAMLTRTEKKILKREFYKQLKIYASAKITGNEETSGKAWKIILAIIACVGLVYLLAVLACNLSCSGSDAAAAIVLVLGITGLVFGMIALMKRIHRGPKKPKEATDG